MEPTRSTDPFCSPFTTTLSWNLPGLAWPCSLGRLAALAGGVAADDQGIFLCPPLRWLLRPPKRSSVAISQHVLKDRSCSTGWVLVGCIAQTSGMYTKDHISRDAASSSPRQRPTPGRFPFHPLQSRRCSPNHQSHWRKDTSIASPKSESPFGKVTLSLFTVSSPWTSEKDHNTYPCCLGIEPRTCGLEVRWINHWATGTLSKCRPRQKQSWLRTSLWTTTGCCVGRLGGCCCHL